MWRNDTVHGPGIAVPGHVPENQVSAVKGSGYIRVRDGDPTGMPPLSPPSETSDQILKYKT